MSGRAVPTGRPRWPLAVFLAVLLVPLVEIAAIVAAGRSFGFWPTLILLVAESALGAWIVRREGSAAWQALRTALSTGRMPSRELADAALILVGGTLLLTPGFVTDVVGFFVIAPPTRPIARQLLEAAVARRLLAPAAGWGSDAPGAAPGAPGAGTVIEGEVVSPDDRDES